jgi:hypothetical protein
MSSAISKLRAHAVLCHCCPLYHRQADNYIKAFYIPWEELGRWAQIHLAEYGKHRVLVLVEAMAEAYGIKRQQKAALIEKLNAELAEFG